VTGYGLRCWVRLRCTLNGYANCCVVCKLVFVCSCFCRFFRSEDLLLCVVLVLFIVQGLGSRVC